jgi:hypothetical protein
MKKIMLNFAAIAAATMMMTSCYTTSHMVGEGPQTGVEVKRMNHYLMYGLAPINIANPVEMAGNAQNYEVMTTHTFVDGLISAITFGIYSPTTTIVRK